MTAIVRWLRGLPPLLRYAIEGAFSVGLIGAIVGLVVGLIVHWPTAPFAVVELGLPAAVIGGVAGLAAGGVVTLARRAKRSNR
jgi:hypothetical protein